MNALRYRTIQYAANPGRGEYRNVGVIAHNGEATLLKLAGLSDHGKIDPFIYCTIGKKKDDEEWIFAEWLHWFDSLARLEGANPNYVWEMLDRIGMDNMEWLVGPETLLQLAEGEEGDLVMKELFQAQVTIPKSKKMRPVRMPSGPRVRDYLDEVGISSRPDYGKCLILDLKDGEGNNAGMLEFDVALTGTDQHPATGFMVIDGAKKATFNQQAIASAYTFQRAVEYGFLDREGCVAVVRPIKDDWRPMLAILNGIATVVILTDRDNSERVIWDIAHRPRKSPN